MKSYQNVGKLIKFCCNICNKLTLATHLNSYRLLSGELTKALDDIKNEYLKEDENRRRDYLTDNGIKEKLLNTYGTNDKVLEYFDRLSMYDLIELDNVKDLLLRYQNELEDTELPIKYSDSIDISLPQDSYLEEKFSVYSHCTIGGVYKVYSFKIDRDIESMLLEICDLYSYYTFNNIYTLDDPAFYDEDKIICSICSHEQTIFLYLNNDQYKTFTELGIPYK